MIASFCLCQSNQNMRIHNGNSRTNRKWADHFWAIFKFRLHSISFHFSPCHSIAMNAISNEDERIATTTTISLWMEQEIKLPVLSPFHCLGLSERYFRMFWVKPLFQNGKSETNFNCEVTGHRANSNAFSHLHWRRVVVICLCGLFWCVLFTIRCLKWQPGVAQTKPIIGSRFAHSLNENSVSFDSFKRLNPLVKPSRADCLTY